MPARPAGPAGAPRAPGREQQARGLAARLGLPQPQADALAAAAALDRGAGLRSVERLARLSPEDGQRAAQLLATAARMPALGTEVREHVDLAAALAARGRAGPARLRLAAAGVVAASAPRPRQENGITFYFGGARPGSGGVTGRWPLGTHVLSVAAPGGPVHLVVEPASYRQAWTEAAAWGQRHGLPLYGTVRDGSTNARDPHEVTDTLGPAVTRALCRADELARFHGMEL